MAKVLHHARVIAALGLLALGNVSSGYTQAPESPAVACSKEATVCHSLVLASVMAEPGTVVVLTTNLVDAFSGYIQYNDGTRINWLAGLWGRLLEEKTDRHIEWIRACSRSERCKRYGLVREGSQVLYVIEAGIIQLTIAGDDRTQLEKLRSVAACIRDQNHDCMRPVKSSDVEAF